MTKKATIIILSIALFVVLIATLSGSTAGQRSDTESSTGNTLTAGVWYEADCLIVDTSDLCLNPAGRWICCVYIENGCLYDITIGTIGLSWTPDEGELLNKIQIWRYDMLEWHGSAPSGTVIDIEDCTLLPGERVCVCLFFDSDMHGKAFTIEFTMGDSSLVTATFDTPAASASLEESGLGESLSCGLECCPEDCQLQR